MWIHLDLHNRLFDFYLFSMSWVDFIFRSVWHHNLLFLRICSPNLSVQKCLRKHYATAWQFAWRIPVSIRRRLVSFDVVSNVVTTSKRRCVFTHICWYQWGNILNNILNNLKPAKRNNIPLNTQRRFDVVTALLTSTTLLQRQNDVVCLLGYLLIRLFNMLGPVIF